jgi:hypothetical protein
MSLTPPELLQDAIDRTLDDEWGEFLLDDDDLRLLKGGSPASLDFEDDEDD